MILKGYRSLFKWRKCWELILNKPKTKHVLVSSPLADHYAEIEEAIGNGVNMTAIAKTYGVSRQAVWDYCHKHFEFKPGNCKECGIPIVGKRVGTKWCSKVCRNKNYKPTPIECVCQYCGNKAMHIKETQFCSVKCAHDSVRKLYADQILERYKKGETLKVIADSLNSTPRSLRICMYRAGIKLTGQIQKICPRCGTQFGGTHAKKYCNPECKKE